MIQKLEMPQPLPSQVCFYQVSIPFYSISFYSMYFFLFYSIPFLFYSILSTTNLLYWTFSSSISYPSIAVLGMTIFQSIYSFFKIYILTFGLPIFYWEFFYLFFVLNFYFRFLLIYSFLFHWFSPCFYYFLIF